MPVPTVVQSATLVNAGGAVVLSSAPTNGNLLVAMQFHFNNSPATSAGWTQLGVANGATNDGWCTYYKIAGAGESTSQTPSTLGSSTGAQIIWEISGYWSGGTTASPAFMDFVQGAFDIASAASYSTTIKTVAANELILGAFECYANQVPTSITGATALDSGAHSGSRGIQGFHTNVTGAAGSTSITVNNSPNVGGAFNYITVYSQNNVSDTHIVQCKVRANDTNSLDLPLAPTNGNLLVALVTHFPDNIVANTGWTQRLQTNGGSFDGIDILTKVAGAGESLTQTPTSSSIGSGGTVCIFEIQGYPGSFIDATFGAVDTASSTTYSHTETTAGSNEVVLALYTENTLQLPAVTGSSTLADFDYTNRGAVAFYQNMAAAGSAVMSVSNPALSGLANYQAISIKLNASGVALTETKFTNTNTFGSDTITVGKLLTETKLTNTSTFGSNTLRVDVRLTTTKYTNTSTFGTDTYTPILDLFPTIFRNYNQMGSIGGDVGTFTVAPLPRVLEEPPGRNLVQRFKQGVRTVDIQTIGTGQNVFRFY